MTITGLEAEDSGKYWCGTNGTPVFIFDYYTELQVTPREGKYECAYGLKHQCVTVTGETHRTSA